MRNPKDFLDLYMTVRGEDTVAIDKAMLALTKSVTEARKWRAMSQMWAGDVELTGGFGYAVELYRRETFMTIDQLSQRLLQANAVCGPHANVIARAVFGFDGRIKSTKSLEQAYAHYLENPKLSAIDLSDWCGFASITDTSLLINLHKRVLPNSRTIWSVWDNGIREGFDQKEMYDSMRAANLSDSMSKRAISFCQIITGIALENYNTREHIEYTISKTPGLTVTEYVEIGVKEGYPVKAYQRQVLDYMRIHGNVVNNLITDHDTIGTFADKTPGIDFNQLVNQLVLAGCYVTSVYQWNKKLEEAVI